MPSLPPTVRVLLAREPADLRKGFDGLSHLVQRVLRKDPLPGHLFAFRNRRRDRVKLLPWDSDGFMIVYKRMERGIFRSPAPGRPWGDQRLDQGDRLNRAARRGRFAERQATTALRPRIRISGDASRTDPFLMNDDP